MWQTRFKLTEFPEHIGTSPVHRTVIARGTVEDIFGWTAEHVDPVKGLEVFLKKLKRRLRYGFPESSRGQKFVNPQADYRLVEPGNSFRDGGARCLILDPPAEAEKGIDPKDREICQKPDCIDEAIEHYKATVDRAETNAPSAGETRWRCLAFGDALLSGSTPYPQRL